MKNNPKQLIKRMLSIPLKDLTLYDFFQRVEFIKRTIERETFYDHRHTPIEITRQDDYWCDSECAIDHGMVELIFSYLSQETQEEYLCRLDREEKLEAKKKERQTRSKKATETKNKKKIEEEKKLFLKLKEKYEQSI